MADYENEEVKKAEEKVKAAEAAAEEARKEAERIAKKAKEEAESKKKSEEAKKEADEKAEEARKEADRKVEEAKKAAEKKADEDKKAEEAKIEAEKKAEEAKKLADAKKAEEDAAKAQAAAAAAAAAAQKQQEAAAAKEAKRNEKKAKLQALKSQCPPQYKPVGTSTFFWLGILCWLPVIGVLISLFMSIIPKNRNIKSFARSKLAYYIIIFIACLIITLVAGAVIPEDNKIEIGNALLKICRSLGFAV